MAYYDYTQTRALETAMARFMTITLLIITSIMLILAVWTQIVAARAASNHPPSGIFVPVTGGRLHLHDMGPRDAPPARTLVLIHGASCNLMALTLPLAEPLLAAGYRVIAIDRPGHGWSDRPGGRDNASPVRQAALIAEALRAVGAGEAVIIAHSFAGAVATTLAMDHPAQVKGLVLLSPVTHPWPGGIAWYYTPGSMPVIGWIFARLLPVPGAALTMEAGIDSVFKPQSKPADYAAKTALPLLLRPANFEANAQDVAALYAHVVARSTRYGEIKVPTTIIAGSADTVVSSTIHAATFGREVAGSKTIILDNVGHAPHHADTALVVREIEAMSARVAQGLL
jgi:pimeloyl-ACP methyl ester carboxylesterase